MTRLRVGSNQYRILWGVDQGEQGQTNLLSQAAGIHADQLHCSQVWGGNCRVLVTGPEYKHAESSVATCHAGSIKSIPVNCPSHVFMELLVNVATGKQVLMNKNCPAAVLDWAAIHAQSIATTINSPIEMVMQYIMNHPRCPMEVYRRVIESNDTNLISALLDTGKCPMELMDLLQQSTKHGWLRQQIALQRCLDSDDLVEMANSDDVKIRRGVATNPSTPTHVLEHLAQDPEMEVRCATLEQSQRLSEQTLAQLVLDPEPLIYWKALDHIGPAAFEQTLQHFNDYHQPRVILARRLECPSDVLRQLAVDTYAEVRAAVAGNPKCPAEVLTILGQDKRSAVVRRTVASNQNCPSATVVSLLADKDRQVRENALNNSNLPDEYKTLRRLTTI